VIGFTAVTLKQGHDGGDLVYKYGANSEAVANVVSDKDDLKDDLDELQEKYTELKESSMSKKEEPKVEQTKEDKNTTSTKKEVKTEISVDANKSK
ncbi:MAG: hypothetical protein KAU90_07150, partial [Sulfurovaceae bacterium]|nr:hypothetical protein [Sulfurovaceae bacterium]